jgi:hypothetical protein
MRELRHLSLIAVAGLLGLSFAAFGCSDDTKPPTTTSTGSSTSTSSSSSGGGEGGNGGTGGTGGTGGMGGSSSGMAKLDTAVTDLIPFDATPDVKGDAVYIAGLDKQGNPVIASAKLDGSAAASKVLSSGAPLVAPLNIAISTDGATLYIADPGAEDATGKVGRIFKMANDGGTLAPITNADGYRARGLEALSVENKDVIYFAGTDPTGVAGIFKVPADDSAPVDVVAKGAPFQDPSGVAVNANGDVFACDTVQDSDRLGIVVSVIGGNVKPLLSGLLPGFPCGVALLEGEKALLVSSRDPVKKTDAVLTIDLSTNMTTSFSMGVDTFVEAAGLHRAKQAGNTFAWADSLANGGTVFRIQYQ